MTEYFRKSPFIRILMPFMTGIILQPSLPAINPVILLFMLFGPVIILMILLIRRSDYLTERSSGFWLTLFFLMAGFYLHTCRNKPVAFSDGLTYRATMLERAVEKANSYAAEVLVTDLFTGDSVLSPDEKLIVYFKKDSDVTKLEPGNRIAFSRPPVEIRNRGNPHEFDYKKYIGRRGIFRQVYLDEKSWVLQGDDPVFRIGLLAEKTRDFLLDIYKRNGLAGLEFEILSALTLGYKKSMDPEIKQVFAATGASHVLAVSGLHVGIVYLVFNLLFGFLRKNRFTRYLFVISATLFLWGFAFITGLSPSVQRSALMFTIVLIGENLRRPANIYNTLAASAFLLLVLNTRLVYDVGFQLSYAAVTGIVYFQPRLNALFLFKSKGAAYLWGLFTVSLAAQITTFPLSCHYFNQFPVYFWLSNFLVIPLAFVFIFLGILLLATSPLPWISALVAKTAIFLLKMLFFALEWIGRLPGALITNVSFPSILMILTYLAVLTLVFFIESRRKGVFLLFTGLILSGLMVSAGNKIIQNQLKEIIAYQSGYPVLHLIYGRSNYIIVSDKISDNDFPEWETGNVVRKMRLKKPVIIAEEEDFTDACLTKRGPYIHFDGLVIKWENRYDPVNRDSFADIVITESENAAKYNEDCLVISYSRRNTGSPDQQNIHRISTKGAWVIRQNLIMKMTGHNDHILNQ